MAENRRKSNHAGSHFCALNPIECTAENEDFRVPSFDVKVFETKSQPAHGYLSLHVQAILSKEPDERTIDDLDLVEDEVHHITFFNRFPYARLRELCAVLRFVEYKKGQTILKEGHKPFAMYVIVAGLVRLFNVVKSERTGRSREVHVEDLSHGMQFGVAELLHDTLRAISARCKSPTQLLKLEKIDFDRFLKKLLFNDEELVTKKLRTNPTLAEFELNEDDMNELLKVSKLGKYPPHSVVLGGSTRIPYYVHFIINGECAIEQEVKFTIEQKLGYIRFRPVPLKSLDQSAHQERVLRKRIEICQLSPGHFFGMGEDLKTKYIRTLDHMQSLMIPRHILVAKHPRIFDKLKEEMEGSFPGVQYILDKYLEVMNWDKYKIKVVREVFGNKAGDKSKGSNHKPPFLKYF